MEVIHEIEKNRFVVYKDGYEAKMTYRRLPNKILSYDHTFVPDELRGNGIAKTIIKTSLAYAKEEGYQVRPLCVFVQKYLNRHPELADIVYNKD